MAKAVVLRVSKSETFGREAKIFGEFHDLSGARMAETALERMSFRGEIKSSDFYVSCLKEHIDHVCSNISAAFISA